MRRIKIWLDPEGDLIEVTFKRAPSYMRDTEHDQVMVRVDTEGHVIGFSILGLRKLRGAPLDLTLAPGS